MRANRPARLVLAGVDGSEQALQATRWAAGEARRRDFGLRVVTVSLETSARDFEFGPGEATAPFAEQQLLKELDRAAEIAREAEPGLYVERAILGGLPADRLKVESARSPMIVLGDRGVGGWRGAWLGSVAGSVASGARCPIVIVRRPAERFPGRSAPVVVGIDGSPAGEAAIGFAFEAAESRGCGVLAVHAWSPGLRDSLPMVLKKLNVDRADHEKLLADSVAEWVRRYPGVAVEPVVFEDHPPAVLVEQSRRAPLIVVGTHGKGRVVGDLLGSVSQALLHRALCPVVVVPPS